MQRIGCVLHVSSNRNLILKTTKTPQIGDKVVNEKLEHVGTVAEVFGPTSSPYVAVKTNVENPQRFVNKILYAISSSKTKRKKRK
ncbi:MAG: Gar1/Naf1 family protein [Thermoproteota archaeon]|nr:Gar1/Naf1 family protein [Thermoproteota archaeon]